MSRFSAFVDGLEWLNDTMRLNGAFWMANDNISEWSYSCAIAVWCVCKNTRAIWEIPVKSQYAPKEYPLKTIFSRNWDFCRSNVQAYSHGYLLSFKGYVSLRSRDILLRSSQARYYNEVYSIKPCA